MEVTDKCLGEIWVNVVKRYLVVIKSFICAVACELRLFVSDMKGSHLCVLLFAIKFMSQFSISRGQ